MTFKHLKFNDSPIMRSLEKVAQEKGLIKPESLLQKLASKPMIKKLNTVPTENLMDNIFKLCGGLRTQGLIAEANELETNYFQYKQARTLYEAHKEKGEDVIHAAHPKGSYKLEGIDSDEATFEDILDQHVKILQKIDKKPTGKLTSTAHVLSEVKKALGQDKKQQLLESIKETMQIVKNTTNKIFTKAEPELTFSVDVLRDGLNNLFNSILQNPKIDLLENLQKTLTALRKRLMPGLMGGVSHDTWDVIGDSFDELIPLIDNAIKYRHEYNALLHQKGKVNMLESVDDLGKKLFMLAAQYNVYSNQITSSDPKYANDLARTKAWLRQKSAFLQQLAANFQNETDKNMVASRYQAALNRDTVTLQNIQKEW